MNTKAKGSRNEARSIAIFEEQGYVCTRSSMSLGVWDVIGIRRDGIVLCQVKTTNWPYSAEMDAIRAFEVPDNAIKVLHRYRNGCATPDVRVVL